MGAAYMKRNIYIKGYIGDKFDFLLLTRVSTSYGLKDVDTG